MKVDFQTSQVTSVLKQNGYFNYFAAFTSDPPAFDTYTITYMNTANVEEEYT